MASVLATLVTLFAGTKAGVFRSEDNGTTWINLGLTSQNVQSLTLNGTTLFAGAEGTSVWQLELSSNGVENTEQYVSKEEISISAIPNPSSSVVYISVLPETTSGLLDVYNLYGQRVLATTFLNSGAATVDVSLLPTGHYTVIVSNDNMIKRKELVIIR